ncbi:glutamate-1-semialdehyde 2,1-aminomutase [Gordonibacter sp.]|uniref:glutamate-1-semialdehyde 2,1-aminomutase n=1 Tax=Gordonibacter sp. TaxID=1968902 RepID=UPI002FCB2661
MQGKNNVLTMVRSEEAFLQAQEVIPGGVDSPVRAALAVGANPLFIERGEGCYLWDVDGNRYIDYVGSWGPLILGHAHPKVIDAVCCAAGKGTSFGAPTEAETLLAREVIDAFPAMEMVRFVNSGTEATMSALRLARGATGRDLIVKFEGCYHGHSDGLLVAAGSGALTMGTPTSAGVPAAVARQTLVARYNDLESVRSLFQARGSDIAGVIVEPVAGNMGVVAPQEGFLQGLRDVCDEYGSLLIIDEVMTGFRVAYGGAQVLFDVEPDLTCCGKIIGGGLPLAAFGGKRAYMSLLAPLGPVYQAGTLSGNPLAVAAGLATLRVLKEPGVYDGLFLHADMLVDGIRRIAAQQGVALRINQVGAMFSLFFTDGEVTDYERASSSDAGLFARFYALMREEGVYCAPSRFESLFLSCCHDDAVIEKTLECVAASLAKL